MPDPRREALERAAKVFRRYAEIHKDKGTQDGERKAFVNLAEAQACEAALASPAAGGDAVTRRFAEVAESQCDCRSDGEGGYEPCAGCEVFIEVTGVHPKVWPELAPAQPVEPETCDHCWHTLDEVFTTCPPIYTDVCCFCPEKRERRPRGEGIMGHGPNHPGG